MSRPYPRVVGLGLVSAVGVGREAFAAAILGGLTGIRAATGPDLPAYRAPLPPLDFESALERYPNEEIATRARETCARSEVPVRAGVLAALEAWHDAGLDSGPPPERIALVAAGNNLTSAAMHEVGARFAGRETYVSPRMSLSLMDSHLLSVVSHVLRITGPGLQVGAASASGNAALISGCRLLATDEADICVVVGSVGAPALVELRALANAGALSWDQMSVPLSTDRAGLIPGEAAAAIVLERNSSARRSRIRTYGEVRGWAHRLHASAGPEPDADVESEVMRRAMESAGITPDRIGYINAHASGSVVGDSAEMTALDKVFGELAEPPWLNATKSITGHPLAASGLVECIATLTQFELGVLHPTVGLTTPISSNLRHPGLGTPLAPDAVAITNSYGFGGFNTSLVLGR
ncbi:beta-ketoacyl synthase N-terminal-like domain-containing protein [Nocardia suismassiliense]|uniref:Beta-ketoacyl synthase N-terminal-like domain-containing protein n=1 Tax=Nocardia suismassiliense TaxID=2077092 RepID=A0ABW6R0U4_9NOCA